MINQDVNHKFIRINELINITGFTRPTLMKLLYNTVLNGSNNSIYNKKLRLYAVRDIDTFYNELSDLKDDNNEDINNNQKEKLCQQKNKEKDYTGGERFIGCPTLEEANNASSQLRKMIFQKQ